MGIVLLEGGSEFSGAMKIPDERALSLCGDASAPVRIIPAAAAPDGNQRNAGALGVRWFERLGATNVRALSVVDRASADRPEAADELAAAALIFLLGGFPGHLAETLAGSRAWDSIIRALRSGAILAGSSAGAMVLCEHYFDPAAVRIRPGLNLIPGACVLPHHDRFGREWAAPVRKELPSALLIGIDEETGMLNDAPDGAWSVHGKGAVTIYEPHRQAVFTGGQRVATPIEVRAPENRLA